MIEHKGRYYQCNIERARDKDLDLILNILWSNKIFTQKEIKSAEEDIIKYIKNMTYYIIISEQTDTLIGCGGYSECSDTNGVFLLTWLAIHPEYHNMGYGSLLLDYIENQIHNGRTIITVSGTDEENKYFYNKNGFIQCGIIPKYYNENKSQIISYKMLLTT